MKKSQNMPVFDSAKWFCLSIFTLDAGVGQKDTAKLKPEA
jgi:hypothetical protein